LGLGKGRQLHDKREKLRRATQEMEARRAVARYK
jgi:tmRNA-binding protein